eukprot:gnl/MRDRNA2_/MRDRNA2_64560_c0_seq1.p1 gnl/MRDRNA2_/MRDRNA2_64560_c0~~gnl/MRDRNA2_/MRDRNA2_64560_c0_seq1.p1  ORF type:complete len:346 (-),score=72.89 gnl/MRDRNA2_/MRDRNA2_64560_c0_seq1:153-1190(-)
MKAFLFVHLFAFSNALKIQSSEDKCAVPQGFKREVNPNAIRKPTQEEMSQPGFYDEPHIEKLFYINLKESKERHQHMQKQLKDMKVPHERWPALSKTEAMKLSKQIHEFSNVGLISPDLKIGTQACYFSHHQLLQHIAKQPDPNAVYIISEDDVRFQTPLEEVECQLKMLPPEWDLFKFGYNGAWQKMRNIKTGSPEPSLKPYKYPECPGDQINQFTCHQTDWNWNYMGNQAYAVRPKGAATVLKHLKNTPVMDVDGAMMGGYHDGEWFNKDINTYVSKHNKVEHRHLYSDLNRATRKATKPSNTAAEKAIQQNKHYIEDDYLIPPIAGDEDLDEAYGMLFDLAR